MPDTHFTDEADLIDLARGGDRDALGKLLTHKQDACYALALRLTADAESAEDVCQETFCRAIRSIKGYRPTGSFSSWLLKIVYRVQTDRLRSQCARAQRERGYEMTNGRERDGLDGTTHRELTGAMRSALDELDQKMRLPLCLHFQEGLTYAEVSDVLAMPRGTVGTNIRRGLERLREMLEGNGFACTLPAVTAALTETPTLTAPAGVSAALETALNSAGAATRGAGAGAGVFATAKAKLAAGAAIAAVIAVVVVPGIGGSPDSPETHLAGPSTLRTRLSPTEPVARRAAPPARVLGSGPLQAPAEVNSLAISPDGSSIAVGSPQGIIVWDAASLAERARIETPRAATPLQYLNSGRRLLFVTSIGRGEKDPFDRNEKARAVLWDLKDDREVLSIVTSTRYPLFSVSPDERTLVVATAKPPGPPKRPAFRYRPRGPRAHIHAWDLKSGKRLPGIDGVARPQTDSTYEIGVLCLSREGTKLLCYDERTGATGRREMNRRPPKRLTVWDWPTRTLLHEWNFPEGYRAQYSGHQSMEWLPGGDAFIVGASLNERRLTLILRAEDGAILNEFDGICTLNPDGKSLVAFADGWVRTYDLNNVSEKKELDAFDIGEVHRLRRLAVGSDGRHLVGWLFKSNSFALVDLKQKKLLAPSGTELRNSPDWLGYSPDGRLLAFDASNALMYDSNGINVRKFQPRYYYRSCRISFGPQGRLFLCGGDSGGKAEVWDSVTGTLLGKLPRVLKGGVKNAYLSRDAQWCAIIGEYDATLQFIDFRSGRVTSAVAGADLRGLRWDASGKRVYLAGCSQASRLADIRMELPGDKRKDPDKTGSKSVSGAFDPRTGKRLFWFRDNTGKPIKNVSAIDLCESRAVLYLANGRPSSSYTMNGVSVTKRHATYGLWDMEDGSFVREVEFAGSWARFNHDGSLLVSREGVTDTASGKRVGTFAKKGWRILSPTRTLFAEFRDDKMIRVVDVRTEVEILRRSYLAPAVEGAKPNKLTWHPSEAQVAIRFNNIPAVVQLDLYDAAVKPEGDASLDTSRAAADLSSEKFEVRDDAVRKLFVRSERSLDALRTLVARSDSHIRAKRMALHVAECLARGGVKPAHSWIEKLSAGAPGNLMAGCARDALARLKAGDRAKELSRKHEKAESITWPQINRKPTEVF